MRIPRKCWPLGIAFVLCGMMAVTTALAGGSPGKGTSETGPPGDEAKMARAVASLPTYMVMASGVNNPGYMRCLRSQVQARGTAEKHLLDHFRSALGCKTQSTE